METVIVDFVAIEEAINIISENTTKMKENKSSIETLITNLGESWIDTISNSYNLYKESSFGLSKDIEINATDIEALISSIKTSMEIYKENEDSGEQTINNIEF